MILWQEHLVPCCGGWHFIHLRVRAGSYHDWLLSRLGEIGE